MKTVSKKLFSLLLVAVLLVSAVPFQAFADAHASSHALKPNTTLGNNWQADQSGHWQECAEVACDDLGNKLTFGVHTYNSESVCTTCGYTCTHASAAAVPSTAVAATCIAKGKTADTVCPDCGKVTVPGTETPVVAHAPAFGICDTCKEFHEGSDITVTIVLAGESTTKNTKQGYTLSQVVTTTPTAANGTFVGWYDAAEGGNKYDMSAPLTASVTLYPHFSTNTYEVRVYIAKNGDKAHADLLKSFNVTAGTYLLDFLKANVTALVDAKDIATPGYSWPKDSDGSSKFWYDFSSSYGIGQTDTVNGAVSVYVNFVADKYTLTFNANGGVYTGTQPSTFNASTKTMPVAYGSKIGTMPTVTKSGSVFMGWKDSNGTIFTADTIYNIASSTTLTAAWENEALVMLRIYVNGNITTPDRIVAMDQYVVNGHITQASVKSYIDRFYTYSSIKGLYTDAKWDSFKVDNTVGGDPEIPVSSGHVTNVYVMLNSGVNRPTAQNNGTNNGGFSNNGGSSNGSSSNNSGTNPKTGDVAMLETAAAVMILAAGALVTTTVLRKKKAS